VANKTKAADAITMGRQGRIVIPSRVRRALLLDEGDKLSFRVEDKRLVLVPQRHEVERLRGMFKDSSGDASVVDELIAERREEARREASA
jgi:AbrB family looped-hinge helix DNA binding protein